jgi:2-polyprenyl-3-methyl-5-hydroxy-6-metoxy-1,4-benzoquinol methylase
VTDSGRYTGGAYLERNPTWHVEDSVWKADQVERLLAAHPEVERRTVAEVGCGAGEILRSLHDRWPDAELVGYEVSPHAHELAASRAADRLSFRLADATEEPMQVDLLLLMDVVEHVDDPLAFLRALARRCRHAVLHIPLDMTLLAVARPHHLMVARRDTGHLHYFVKETALETVRDGGFEVVDWRYTEVERRRNASRKQRVLDATRRLVSRVDRDLAVRLAGGASLLVLARPR